MRMRQKHGAAAVMAALLAAVPVVGHAQTVWSSGPVTDQGTTTQDVPQQPPPPTEAQLAQMRQEVQEAASWRLPPDFLTRMAATLQALRNANLQPPAPGGHISLNETIARVQAVPGIDPILRAHGFTPREFVMGLTGFGITYAVTSNPQAQQSGKAPKLNPANVKLLQSNPTGVQVLLQEMGAQPGQGQQQ
ncbi:hypothetical protein AA0472_0627 [Acetobacter estunensis NRIC 0472]|uniref:Uncharacterized protein n=1 Tax=Acetobacter estunensis TaxID=104097 RepID=A0A967B603_9PROT|nr:hypothetical protein [Acetobacter estunensis]NHO54455.1 hypothetical protein [Acetobacter estunensis]GBQ21997.1 hypothetical protein AA0472_0627 [Acetobacter estunensis NRIC 0472]